MSGRRLRTGELMAGGGTSRPEKICCCQYDFTWASVFPRTSRANASRAFAVIGSSTAATIAPDCQLMLFFRKSLATSSFAIELTGLAVFTMIVNSCAGAGSGAVAPTNSPAASSGRNILCFIDVLASVRRGRIAASH